MGKVIELKTKFTDKKDSVYVGLMNEKLTSIRQWFEEKWPESNLYIDVVFSRSVVEPLEVRKEIVLKNKIKTTVSSVTTIAHNTWHIPLHMERALDKFEQDQKNSIAGVMTRNGH